MKNNTLYSVLILLTLLLSNCKKEKEKEEQEPQFTAKEYFLPMKTGNFWVYEMEYESGNYPNYTTHSYTDTVKVTRDTIIDGRTWFEIQSRVIGIESGLFADSSGWILQYGSGIYPLSTVANDTVRQDSVGGNLLYVVYKTGTTDTSITVPAGTFQCTEMIWDAYYLPGPPPVPNPNPRPVFTYFARNIGIAKCRFWYASASGNSTLELLSYYIQP